jgi:hypothetical protein
VLAVVVHGLGESDAEDGLAAKDGMHQKLPTFEDADIELIQKGVAFRATQGVPATPFEGWGRHRVKTGQTLSPKRNARKRNVLCFQFTVVFPQAGRRGFEPRLPLYKINNLQAAHSRLAPTRSQYRHRPLDHTGVCRTEGDPAMDLETFIAWILHPADGSFQQQNR